MIEIIKRKYGRHSHIPLKEIKKMRQRHGKALIQPRIEGELNREFLREYGAKNLRITEHDVKRMEKKDHNCAKKLVKVFEKQDGGNNR